MELRDEIEKIVERYADRKSAIMPSLYLAQEKYGYLDEKTLLEIADILLVPNVDVFTVATFYSMFATEPRGKNHIMFCTNLSCRLAGAEDILKVVKEELKLGNGKDTTEDSIFSLEIVECLGACDKAPVMMINEDTYFNLDKEKVTEIINKLKEDA